MRASLLAALWRRPRRARAVLLVGIGGAALPLLAAIVAELEGAPPLLVALGRAPELTVLLVAGALGSVLLLLERPRSLSPRAYAAQLHARWLELNRRPARASRAVTPPARAQRAVTQEESP